HRPAGPRLTGPAAAAGLSHPDRWRARGDRRSRRASGTEPPARAPGPRSPRSHDNGWSTSWDAVSQGSTMRLMTPSSPSPTTEDTTAPGAPSSTARSPEDRSARFAVTVFPVLILASAVFAFFVPAAGQAIDPFTAIFLGIIMFAMGLTLTVPDFALVARRPLPVLIGVVAQYAIMPLVGLGVALLLQLPPELAVGVILVGSAPGGTSSNVIAYLSKADTALSVTMTSISTLLAPLLTPLLTLWLAGSYLPVDAGSMAMSIVKMVLIPVIGGLVIRLVAGRLVDRILPALPWVSVAGISLVVIAVVSGSTEAIVSAGAIVLLAVVLHNGLGYLLGYWVAR